MQPGAERIAATFDGLTRVVAEPMRFKAKLAIGEDAYGSLRATRALSDLWQVTGAAAAGGVAASSTAVAGTFFGGWLSALGLTAAATTPVGWVVGAATAAGAAGWGVIHLLRRYEGSRVQKVPRFITTPLDLLGASLFDMIAALALLMAREADQIDEAERHAIKDYFVTEWGLDPAYADRALPVIEAGLDGASVEGIARALAEFKRDNPDCNYEAMTAEVIAFLTEIAGADGQVSPAEIAAISRIGDIFRAAAPWSLGGVVGAVSSGVGAVAGGVAEAPGWLKGKLTDLWPGSTEPPPAEAAEPPIPVLWLLGKTGAGKSSLIRAMTGASAAEIGNGFVPCTRTALAFDFPPQEPLMRFLDTRGLGETAYDPAEDLASCHDAAHVLLVLARLDDPVQGAVAEALTLARRGRKLPALLIHTAPDMIADPAMRERMRHTNQTRLDAAWGAPLPAIELELGQPETADLAALAAALTDILPSVAQFLASETSSDAEEAEFLLNRALVLRYAGMATAGGAVPLPLVGAASVPVLQARMLTDLAARYGIDWDRNRLAALAGALGVGILGGQAVRLAGRQLMSLIPVIGQTAGPVLGAGWGGASTWALGRAAAWWMFQIRTGQPVDNDDLRARYANAFTRKSDAQP